MTNREKFKSIFGVYAEEFWAYPKDKMLDWLQYDVPDTNVGDTISRQAAIDEVDGVKVDEEYCTEYDIGYNDGIDFAVSRLSVLPSAQRKGKWDTKIRTIHGHKIPFFFCSECGKNGIEEFCYCPNCGAWMKGEEDE